MTQSDAHLAGLAQRMAQLSGGSTAPPPLPAPDTPREKPAVMPPILLRPKQAARLCGVSLKTLRKWRVPYFEHENVRGYRPADLEKFVANHMVRSRQEPS